MKYTTSITLPVALEEAVPRVKEALKAEGFGTLTEIDIKATLNEKIGAEIEPYVILGACNPNLAFRALTAEREIGALLPCNVVVREGGDGVIVDALDPAIMATVTANPELGPIAEEAAKLIGAALDSLQESQ